MNPKAEQVSPVKAIAAPKIPKLLRDEDEHSVARLLHNVSVEKQHSELPKQKVVTPKPVPPITSWLSWGIND